MARSQQPQKAIKTFEPNVNHVLSSQKIERRKTTGEGFLGWRRNEATDEDLVDDALNHDEDALPTSNNRYLKNLKIW